ncbi:hypothetical protein SAMN04487965_2309 [Microbulbifer donghaiensis]|uniref:Lipoprotein n=1 Tax=Microbulbifer donghaiensis TaxID=494016 RepID=A0A1M5CVA2_9GAMM|nr:hypothetical protein [Microbulbifer donghaiensis]SHF58352.1 hypothetical protein SAMN04487965_2309 [Microbulbifer donghaiensis]
MKSSQWIAPISALMIAGCAGSSFDGFRDDLCGTPQAYTYRTVPVAEMPAFPGFCIADDVPMSGLGQCMEQGVNCYQLDNGNWCAGPFSPFVISYRPNWP